MNDITVRLNEYLINECFNGTVLVGKSGNVAFSKGYGKANFEFNTDNHPGTIFRIASISKSFTAIAILQLVEQGLLELHEPIHNHIPTQCGSEKITIHHLLTHTSGIVDYINGMEESQLRSWIGSNWSPSELMDRFCSEPLEFHPGTRYSYSNSGYFLLGLILEQSTGISLKDYLTKHIFMPANMLHSFVDDHTNLDFAAGYEMNSEGKVIPSSNIRMSNAFASGNILSNVLDLYNWRKALHTNQLLNKLSTEMMYTPHADATVYKYGYGWITQHTQYGTLVGHSGGIFGYCSIYLDYLEADTTIIVLSNLFKPVDVIARKAAEIMST